MVFVPVSVTAMAGIPAQHAGMASGFPMTGDEVGADRPYFGFLVPGFGGAAKTSVTGCFFSCVGLRISRPFLLLPDIRCSRSRQVWRAAAAAQRKGWVVRSGWTPV
jgi:hypothetical protein